MDWPPPTLASAHVLEYAISDATVTFEQRRMLNVDGRWLGEVPRLAICRALTNGELLVFHCSADWGILGVAAGYLSVADAKEKIELSYHGLGAKWVPSGYSREDAVRYMEAQRCTFCGHTPVEFAAAVGDGMRICNHCAHDLHQILDLLEEPTQTTSRLLRG